VRRAAPTYLTFEVESGRSKGEIGSGSVGKIREGQRPDREREDVAGLRHPLYMAVH